MDLQRRDFIKILGGATVATALPGCTLKKPHSLIPYVIPDEEIIPGKAVWYATVCRECPAGCGLHVRVREGRAVKAEGNPVHPVNQGALCSRGQASLQGMYNPDRIQHPLLKTASGGWQQITWADAEKLVDEKISELTSKGRGDSIAWMTPHVTGALDDAVDGFLRAVGSRRRLRYEPFAFEGLKRANDIAFGKPVIPSYHFDKAKFVLSFGADFLETWISPVGFARDFAAMREFNGTSSGSFVYVGPRLSMTATNADVWISVPPGTEGAFALALLNVIMTNGLATGMSLADANDLLKITRQFTVSKVAALTGVAKERIRTLALDLGQAKPSLVVGGGTVLGGESEAAALVGINLLNYALGNIGTTVDFDVPMTLSDAGSYADLSRFARSMEQGEVSLLFLSETNPVYATPPSANFAHALDRVLFTVAFSSFMDETTARATLVLPTLTPLESWGDHEPVAGVRGLLQPVMQPVFADARMLGDVLLRMTENVTKRTTYTSTEQPFLAFVRDRWRQLHRSARTTTSFDVWWNEQLANGGTFAPSSPARRRVSWRPSTATLSRIFDGIPANPPPEFTLVAYPSLHHFDGRGANRPWLQEVPDPMTQLTWENWVEIHPRDAQRFGIAKGDLVELHTQHGTIEIRAYVYAGVRQGTIAVPIGQGHTEYGRYAQNTGSNVLRLLPPLPLDSSGGIRWTGVTVGIVNKGQRKQLADVAGSDHVHGRNIVQVVTVEELLRQTKDLQEGKVPGSSEAHGTQGSESLYPEHEHPDHRWGMTIDLDKCTGCSACVTACYAENNIPVVGRTQVEIGRELSWLRVERYFDDVPVDPLAPYTPNAEFLPMMCQHCDNAPCEPVCPVYAAYHTPEGLNAQVYNRCVGTRYCSNNCPYKVRRFNWFDYEFPEPLNWQLNPDVTVRSKGVMEKCTMCVQRIVDVRTTAKQEGRSIVDGEITTACQQACPSQAIVFGDLKDPESRVNKLRDKNAPRGYRVLEELNTQPAVVYLKEIRM